MVSGAHLLILLLVAVVPLIVLAATVLIVVRIARRSDPEAARLRREADELRQRAEQAEHDTDGLV